MVFRRTILLICGEYQLTICISTNLAGSAVLNCLICLSILKVSKGPAGLVMLSCATTLDELVPLKFVLVEMCFASNSERHVLPTASGSRMPCPSLGLNFQTRLSMQFQS